MLKTFKEAGEKNSRKLGYQFWQQDNEPKVIYTPAFGAQKLEYVYSSARDYYYGKQCGLIKIEYLL